MKRYSTFRRHYKASFFSVRQHVLQRVLDGLFRDEEAINLPIDWDAPVQTSRVRGTYHGENLSLVVFNFHIECYYGSGLVRSTAHSEPKYYAPSMLNPRIALSVKTSPVMFYGDARTLTSTLDHASAVGFAAGFVVVGERIGRRSGGRRDPLGSWLRRWPAKTNEGSAVGSAVGVAVGSSVPVLNVSGVLLPLDFLDL
jgi:hypothetical protein